MSAYDWLLLAQLVLLLLASALGGTPGQQPARANPGTDVTRLARVMSVLIGLTFIVEGTIYVIQDKGYYWLLLAFPLLGFVINAALGRRFTRNAIAVVGCASIGFSFVVALYAYIQEISWSAAHEITQGNVDYYSWVVSGGLKINFGMLIDPLSIVMLLVVTGVGFLIHIYSVGYMREDRDYSRFFAYMNLFIFSMLVLVTANNFLFLLVGWGLVGLSSYLLIGFWYTSMAAVLAARKAFIMNVIGDVGIMLAIFLMVRDWGTLTYAGVFARAATYHSGDTTITVLCLLLVVGAIAKSAQIPLHTWLPDAMEGPTPVSALIHAATMVTAGVYLIARCHVLFELAPFAAGAVAIIGATTALVAATIAMVQVDIKRVLAYSTMSQIGYMFLGDGVGAYSSAMFHLVTHAFFKALLFMGAGSIIHAMGGEQDLRKMGDLRKHLPRTYALFTVGVLAISGIPPLSGFWSKDEILAHTSTLGDWHLILWFMAVVTAGLTVFYMFRLWYLAFYGRSRVDKKIAGHLHESPQVMLVPMYVLALLAAIGGFMQLPGFGKFHDWLNPVLNQYLPSANNVEVAFQWLTFGVLLVLIAVAWLTAYDLYRRGPRAKVKGSLRYLYQFLWEKWYFDALYNLLFERPAYALATFCWQYLDRGVIDGAVNAVARSLGSASEDVRPIESGYVRTYALTLVVGVVLVLALAIGQK
jgi:NADH-quinone oxidoreductase subunit L